MEMEMGNSISIGECDLATISVRCRAGRLVEWQIMLIKMHSRNFSHSMCFISFGVGVHPVQ